ncbi:MAG: PAS domain S-box protein [Holophagales bacterium]|nr:PAS domain S-box protein [Holophagales bacterium]
MTEKGRTSESGKSKSMTTRVSAGTGDFFRAGLSGLSGAVWGVWTAGFVSLAWLVREFLYPFLGAATPFGLIFLPAILGASWCFGRNAGLLATALSTAAGAIFLYHAEGWTARTVIVLDLFLLISLASAFALASIRRSRDEALKREEMASRFAAVVDSSEDAIIVKDLDGRIREWNRSAERLFGYNRQEVIGQSIEILMPGGRMDDWKKILGRLIGGERVEHFETQRRTRDGRILDVSLTVSPVRDRDGRIVGAAKIVRDVTADLEARREADRTRELFLGTLGHELRNPLNAIAVSVHTLKRRTPEATQPILARILGSTDRMSRMIDQLLDFTRSRLGGGIPLQPTPGDFASICRAAADEIEVLYPGRIRFSAEGDLSGRWDADRLHQVLANLLSNAFLYGAKGEPVGLTARGDGASVRVDVTNRGPAIAEDALSMIFDPFRRGPTATGRSGQGLGLFIAHEIVLAHRGEISVRSDPVEGTTFSVKVPR